MVMSSKYADYYRSIPLIVADNYSYTFGNILISKNIITILDEPFYLGTINLVQWVDDVEIQVDYIDIDGHKCYKTYYVDVDELTYWVRIDATQPDHMYDYESD